MALTPLCELVSDAWWYSVLMGTFFFLSERCNLINFLFLSLVFSLSVLMLWFPLAFLNQEIASQFWHLQEVLESSGDSLSLWGLYFPGRLFLWVLRL